MELKGLISLYTEIKLRESGFINTSSYSTLENSDKEILKAAMSVCSKLEHEPRFSDVLKSFSTFGIQKESFRVVLKQLLVGELNWARVMSVVALTGALAVQCMENGEEHKIDFIVDWSSYFAETELKNWIDLNGGMRGLLNYSRQEEGHISHWERNLIAAGTVGVLIGLFVASKA